MTARVDRIIELIDGVLDVGNQSSAEPALVVTDPAEDGVDGGPYVWTAGYLPVLEVYLVQSNERPQQNAIEVTRFGDECRSWLVQARP